MDQNSDVPTLCQALVHCGVCEALDPRQLVGFAMPSRRRAVAADVQAKGETPNGQPCSHSPNIAKATKPMPTAIRWLSGRTTAGAGSPLAGAGGRAIEDAGA